MVTPWTPNGTAGPWRRPTYAPGREFRPGDLSQIVRPTRSSDDNPPGPSTPRRRPKEAMSEIEATTGTRHQRTFQDVYPSLFRYCFRLTGDADAAEDAAQEAFVRLFERKPTEESRSVRVWLFRVATNVIRDRARVQSGRRDLLERHGESGRTAPSPEGQFERRETRALVRRVLDRIPERDRRILLMREEGFRYREIAETVGVKSTSVGTLLARAERRFVRAHAVETGRKDR